jgi:hypothetical protein
VRNFEASPEGIKSNTEKRYFIDRIVDRRHCKEGTQYLVQWLNYSDEVRTWEPAASLVGLNICLSTSSTTF